MNSRKPTERFSDRVTNYIQYRPSYPAEIIPYLEAKIGLHPGMIVADIGSGTGILSKQFLDYGCQVYAVEPNPEMRAACEAGFSGRTGFTSINATAEATTIAKDSIDLVTAGQAYHWFNPPQAKKEFYRILKPQGATVLLWNGRNAEDPFIEEFESVIAKFSEEFIQASHTRIDKDKEIKEFFSPGSFHQANFPNQQIFDFEGLAGRLLSSSYAPLPGHPNHEPMLGALKDVFHAFQTDGNIIFRYVTHLYWSRLA